MSALRVTGNATFVLFATGCIVRRGAAARRLWRGYLGAHALHAALLGRAAIRGRRAGTPTFTSTSRYGGALGYAAVLSLTATRYVPGAPRGALQQAGQHILFGLYAFTIAHGFLAKGREARVYGPLAALWVAAAARGRAQGPDAGTGPVRAAASSTFVTV